MNEEIIKKEIMDRYVQKYTKMWGIKPSVAKSRLWWKDMLSDVLSEGLAKGRELELERIEEDIDNLKTFIAGKHRFWKCKCGGWHYGEVYKCPLELERKRIREELLKSAPKIEEACGKIYEVGHAHGGNAFRMLQNKPAIKVNIGWGKGFNDIIRILNQVCSAEGCLKVCGKEKVK